MRAYFSSLLGGRRLAGSPFFTQASFAGAIENDLVVLNPESGRRHRFYPGQAFFKFEDLAADAAEKMMMMPLIGELVAGHLPGNFHANNPAIFGECFERTINRCDSQTRSLPDGQALNFQCSERVPMLREHSLNGLLLPGASFHRSQTRRPP
jgi:hypothetical protein